MALPDPEAVSLAPTGASRTHAVPFSALAMSFASCYAWHMLSRCVPQFKSEVSPPNSLGTVTSTTNRVDTSQGE